MKLLLFAHTPPPHHGQSFMVQLMLEAFGGDQRKRELREKGRPEIECYHVNARFSDNLEDVGAFRFEKVWLLLRYCLEAIWCRFRFGVRTFYYVPAPGKRAALYRDWIVMLMCRPFFRHFIHHWHAVGLGDWLRDHGTMFEQWMTHRLLGEPSLGIALAVPSIRDALWFRSEQVEIVPNGIPDPCPEFEQRVLSRRRSRLSARQKIAAGVPLSAAERAEAGGDPEIFRVLFLAHCTREKGLFDTLEAVALANSQLRKAGSLMQIHLTVAGGFPHPEEEVEFTRELERPDLAGAVTYAGFVSGAAKTGLLEACDTLCFPSYYHAESFGLVVVEAMAAGMSIVTTRWRAIPELLPADYPGFVPLRSPQEVAKRLQELFSYGAAETLRQEFLQRFSAESHQRRLRDVLLQAEAHSSL